MRESRMGRWMPSYGVEPAWRRHIALGSCVSVRTIWLFAILFTLLHTTQADGDLAGDSNALLAFRDAVDLRKSLKWSSSVNACQWEGVTCAGNPLRISNLRLPGSALSGPIPSGTLGNLTELIILSLRLNRFSGSLPADLANCVLLRGIYLQINNFSGPLPSDFSVWPHLQRVDFSFNHFSGNIPSSFNSLPRLRTLLLQNNSFTGSLTPLNISSVTNFSVANNELNGSIPVPLRRFLESDFLGNHLCGLPLTAECLPVGAPRPASVLTHKKSRKLGTGAIVGIVLGGAAFLSLLCIICIILCRGEKERDVAPRDLQVADRSVNETSENLPKQEFAVAGVQEPVRTKLVFFEGSKQTFELEELLKASAEVLGKGSVGTAYKAMLEDGTVVAVKRLKDVTIERSEFEEKIREIGILRHENLVPLRAYYFSRDEKLLVYDYMPRGSLSALLHGNKGAGRTPLDWETRIRIALGAARGIAYLHEEGKNDRCAHGNIKSSNILLSGNLDGCVSDYGLSQIIGSTSAANRIVGYRAPEVTDINKVTQKADVYSFGVLLLELLTGKAPTQASLNEEGIDDLPRWVQSVVREEWTAEVFDLELMRYQNIEEDMLQTLQVAMLCVSLSPDQRPSMKEVVKMIEDARKADGYGKKPSEADEGRWQGNGSEIDDRV